MTRPRDPYVERGVRELFEAGKTAVKLNIDLLKEYLSKLEKMAGLVTEQNAQLTSLKSRAKETLSQAEKLQKDIESQYLGIPTQGANKELGERVKKATDVQIEKYLKDVERLKENVKDLGKKVDQSHDAVAPRRKGP